MSQPLKQPFSQRINGIRIHLELTNYHHTAQVWQYIQRDHALGGSCYKWIESEEDVAKYITKKPKLNLKEIDYLIIKDGYAIGSIHVHSINYLDYKAEIGYAIEKGEEGHGYVSEAVGLIENEMKRLGFNKLIISCSADNIRSIKVAERNGYRKEGVLLQDFMEKGKFKDSILFGKILGEQ